MRKVVFLLEYSYQFRIYPTAEQAGILNKTFGCCRFVFNHYLDKRRIIYKETGQFFAFNQCCKDLTSLKREYPWLAEVDSTALQAVLRDLDNAYQNFFRERKKGNTKQGYPKFKSKKRDISSYKAKNNKGTVSIIGGTIRLPKIGYVKCKVSKKVEGQILSATVRKNPSGKYFVSICCKDVNIQPLPVTGAVTGVDLGIKDLAITSDGVKFDNPHTYAKNQKKLARLQRQLSRKTKGSKNCEKARIKVARLHERIANQGADTIHKMTTQLIREYDVICIEDLSVKNMARNHKLAKQIMDASWGEVRRQLTYKSDWYKKELIVIDRFFPSSQTCGVCGLRNTEVKDLSVRYWTCPQCGAAHDRDINAAKNILAEGLRQVELLA